MIDKHFYILSALEMRLLRKTLKRCHQVLDCALDNGMFVDETSLIEPIGSCLWYFKKDTPYRQLTAKEIEELF